jgi:hypothetical protein
MEEGERVWFHAEGGHQRKSKLRTKRANIRSSDAGEVTRARGERGGGCSNGAQLGLTLTTLGVEPFLAPPPSPSALMWVKAASWATGIGFLNRRSAWAVSLCGLAKAVQDLVSFKEKRPLLFTAFYFYF